MIKSKLPEVYQVTNLVDGKSYIGVTTNGVRRRWLKHLTRAKQNTYRGGNCPAFHTAIREYGPDNFVVEHIFTVLDTDKAYGIEQEFIKARNTKTPCGYNMTHGGKGVPGLAFSEETCLLRSKAARGRKVSDETRAKMSAVQKGKTISEEARRKTSETRKRRFATDPEFREIVKKGNIKSGETRRGKPHPRPTGVFSHSEETRAKMSAWQVGKVMSQETKDRIGRANKAVRAAKKALREQQQNDNPDA